MKDGDILISKALILNQGSKYTKEGKGKGIKQNIIWKHICM